MIGLATHGGMGTIAPKVDRSGLESVGAVSAPQSVPPGVSISYPVTVPAGYSRASGLTAPAGTGNVWYFAESSSQYELFDYSVSSGTVKSYGVPHLAALRSGVVTPIAIGNNGTVWVGINDSLVGIEPSSGAVSVVPLPTAPLVAQTVEAPPPTVPGLSAVDFEDVDSLAAESNGSLVIGRLYSSVLQTYSPSTGKFGAVELPVDTVLTGNGADLAVAPNGVISVIVWASAPGTIPAEEVAEWNGVQWVVEDVGCSALNLVDVGATLLASGRGCAASQEMSAVVSGSAMTSLLPSGTSGVNAQVGPGIPVSQSETLLATAVGAELVSPSSQVVETLSLGSILVGSGMGGGPAGALPSATSVVPVTLGVMASNGQGLVWFLPAEGGESIGLMVVQ